MHTVQEWLGITREEMLHKVQYEIGKCAKCGKPAMNEYATLCRGHHSAFHKWQKQQDFLDTQPKLFRVKKDIYLYHPSLIIVKSGAVIQATDLMAIIISEKTGDNTHLIVTDREKQKEYIEELPYAINGCNDGRTKRHMEKRA